MITLSENARKELEAYFADKERQTIRVYLAPGGCSGPRLVLALDEPGDEDARFEQDGFAFCINKELLQQVKSVSIDLSYLGFTVNPKCPCLRRAAVPAAVAAAAAAVISSPCPVGPAVPARPVLS